MNLREFARGKTCTARIFDVCNQDPSTVVLAHCRLGFLGAGTKPPDLCAAHVCSSCHDVLDGRVDAPGFATRDRYEIWLYAIIRTLDRVSREFDEWE